MKLSKFIFITIILISSFGCKKKEVPESDFEKGVLNSVFVEIVDSIYMDRRIILPSPPPRFNLQTNKADTIGHSEELKKYWRYQDSIKKDTTRILIGVYDYVINNKIKNEKFDLTAFKSNKKFDFQYASKFPDELHWTVHNYKSGMPVGTIEISNIKFNKNKTLGIIEATASCGGGKCGRGFEITIENKSGKWHIAKIVQTWVS
ncbi:hypothetical protein L1276_001621 [Flavobacterium sp. HSC-32F16]|uniref:hypothetical protein n=1 Tax=Flavobacterium sp. HSC-32F16 TaxID=2910964 RepID=UPI0020A246CC|nr:hypothetical protein [Flavobacterium sp. HSC-32F16]MCP2026477.1 hypothetical protein [Flavobacterium sp. HSC-32F16]